ncbi:phage tail assembly chaperone family protein, TAC [Pseudomonas juntendi]|jgi:hypothetical protein|uniref:phage tail assembly chaperone family protein, TAC n=1 Tax=Pseudomonas juntendi TaxID=2666183 RepID=UPI0018E69851|nr:phage tail assembly chaperone family protein, TAC [Pseudomonas juntendi]MBI6916547.1 phage tail assembly chaperone family protein, TAC [Pseudomonas juntendi]MDG9809740.1 phage tail assembly chaperone family protein, TAC [Pseudomonas juntendi]
MKLSIQNLQEVGAFTGAPVEKTITWKQGTQEFTATVYVRLLGYQSAVSDLIAVAGKHDGVAGRIASCICDEAGQPIFKIGDITGEADPARGALDGNLTVALLSAIGEVNNPGKTQSSPSSTSSSTSSPSPSVAPSPNAESE